MKRLHLEIGAKYGDRTIVSNEVRKTISGNSKFLCRCICGSVDWVSGYYLLKGSALKCRSCFYKRISTLMKGKPTKLQAGRSGFVKVLNRYKGQARRRGLNWELTEDRSMQLFLDNCFYCNNSPSYVCKPHNGRPEGHFTYNGIDRLDNLTGYAEYNVVTCCKLCNWAKGQMSVDEFDNWIDRVYTHRHLKKGISVCS